MKQNIDDLERKIKAKMTQIKQNNLTPKESGIGQLFKYLKPLDEALHEKLITEYKVVFEQWKKNN